jgi:ankyrin repeat protein
MKLKYLIRFIFILASSSPIGCLQDGSTNDQTQKKEPQTTPIKSSPEANRVSLTKDFLEILAHGDAQAIPELIKKGFKPNENLEINYIGKNYQIPALHCVVGNYYGCKYNKNIIESLIKNGADINKKFDDKQHFNNDTPLIAAVQAQNAQAVEDLLSLGADPNILFDTGTALHLAVEKSLTGTTVEFDKMLKISEALIGNSNTKLELLDRDGHTPLYYAYYRYESKLPVKAIDKLKPIIDLFAAKGVSTYK